MNPFVIPFWSSLVILNLYITTGKYIPVVVWFFLDISFLVGIIIWESKK